MPLLRPIGHPDPTDGLVVSIDYHGLRMRLCKGLLVEFLRRWGIYLMAGLAIFSVGSNAPVELAAALAGSLILPMLYAARHVEWLAPAILLYAFLGALPVICTRPLWWPRQWAVAERALPLPRPAIRRSDRVLALWLMLPWQCLLLVGGTAAWWRESSAQQAGLGWAAGAWALSALCSLFWSLAWMQWVRHLAKNVAASMSNLSPSRGWPRIQAAQPVKLATVQPTHWIRVHFLLPLLRGPATRSARALAAGLLAALTCGTGTLWPTLGPGWPLAALAVTSLIATGVLRARSINDLLPLQQAGAHLPMAPGRWHRARTALTLIPMTGGLLAALPGTLLAPGLRPLMLLAYVLIVGLGCAWESVKADKASHRAARWVLTLALAFVASFELTST